MANSGWVKLHRKLLDNPICGDNLRFKAWIMILLIVNHEPKSQIIKGNYVTIDRGETIRSLRSLSELFGCTVVTTKKILEQLQKEGMISYKCIPGMYTVVKVNKYKEFQGEKDDKKNSEYNSEYNTDYNNEYNTDYTRTRMNKNDIKNEKEKGAPPSPSETVTIPRVYED